MISATPLDTVQGGLAVVVAVAEKYHHETADQIAHRFGRVGTHRPTGRPPAAGGRALRRCRLGHPRLGAHRPRSDEPENEAGVPIATGAAAYVISWGARWRIGAPGFRPVHTTWARPTMRSRLPMRGASLAA